MNNVELTKEQVQSITEAFAKGESVTLEPPQSRKIELKGGNWFLSATGEYAQSSSTPECRDFGMEFPTREIAERELISMRKRNRLAARMVEIDPDWEPYWNNTAQEKFTVFLNHSRNKYGLEFWQTSNYFAPLCSHETAKQLCEELNSGRFIL